MSLIVNSTEALHGKTRPPSSKSYSIRAIVLASLTLGKSELSDVLDSDDAQDAISICQALGSEIIQSGSTLSIRGAAFPLRIQSDRIHSGNSGIATHFVLPLLGLRENTDKPIVLNCGDQMRARPVKSLVDALSQLGLNITYLGTPGNLPVSITGTLRGGKVEIDNSSSQPLSALLMALPSAAEDSEIRVRNLCERPYIEMTLQYLEERGIQISHESRDNMDTFRIKGHQRYQTVSKAIQSDFSSASYLIAAAALIPGDVVLKGLDMKDPQGDKRLIPILQAMGADIVIADSELRIRGGKPLTGMPIDAHDIPDLLPTLAVIGTYASGKTEIGNAGHARIKETDRLHSMKEGLTRMGASIEEYPDGLTIHHGKLQGAQVKGYNDHRTVMALGIAGMIAEGTTEIDDSHAINKTFPTFVETMQRLGAKMEIRDGVA